MSAGQAMRGPAHSAAVVRAAALQQRQAVPPIPVSAPFASASLITSQLGLFIITLATATDSGRGILPHVGAATAQSLVA